MDRENITDQSSFLSLLADHGFKITQSTLSRHLRKLGVRKQSGIYRFVEATSGHNPNLALEVVASPPNLLVIKTLPGHANAVGYYFESRDMPGIAGTVAGNDTLFVAVSSPEYLEPVRREIIKLFKLEDHPA